MGDVPPQFTYEPPPKEQCEEGDFPVDLTETDRFHVRTRHYKGRLVDFAIMQIVVVDGEEFHVARIDTCHGAIHEHRYDRHGVDVLDGRTIMSIPEADAWAAVEDGYTEAYDMMFDQWQENRRRWQQ